MIHESVGQWAAVIGFLAAAGVSAAYLIYQKSIINTIQAGGNTISITEDFEPPKKQEVGDNIFKKEFRLKIWMKPLVLFGFLWSFQTQVRRSAPASVLMEEAGIRLWSMDLLTLRIFPKTGVIFLWKRIRCWEAFIIIQFQ